MRKNNSEEILEEIKEVKEENKLIIVEGKNDQIALENLGLTRIFSLNNGHPFKNNIETISNMSQDVIILTDFDKEGKDLHDKLKTELVQLGVRIDEKLRKILAKDISHIQGLASFIENLS